jgi:hypothetical protein
MAKKGPLPTAFRASSTAGTAVVAYLPRAWRPARRDQSNDYRRWNSMNRNGTSSPGTSTPLIRWIAFAAAGLLGLVVLFQWLSHSALPGGSSPKAEERPAPSRPRAALSPPSPHSSCSPWASRSCQDRPRSHESRATQGRRGGGMAHDRLLRRGRPAQSHVALREERAVWGCNPNQSDQE